VAHEIWLIRHGETEWSLSGAHTGKTDLPLTPKGIERAQAIPTRLAGHQFAIVLTSPLERARETARIAGFGAQAQIEPNLMEWDYGEYEGRTTDEIRRERPGWFLWRDGVPGGETIEHVAARARTAIAHALAADGDAALFAHGHILRILTACWLELPPDAGRLFVLGTAGISVLGHERETRAIVRWNLP
jgi:broad specificity phosphatase PhoE